MKRLFFILCWILVALTISMPMQAKKESKLPGSYNFTRGVDALNEGDIEECKKFMTFELQDNPKNGYAYVWLASAAFNEKEYGESLEYCDKAIRFLPKNASYYRAYVVGMRAEIYFVFQDTAKAIADLGLAIKMEPDNPQHLLKRAMLFSLEGDIDASNADYSSIIELFPSNTAGYIGLASNLQLANDFKESLPLLDYAIHLDKNNGRTYALRAKAYYDLGNFHKSSDDIITALAIDNDDLAFDLLKSIGPECSTILEAKLKVKQISDPGSVKWHWYSGILNETHGNFPSAIEEYRMAINDEPDAYVSRRISVCFWNIDEFNEALKWILQAIELKEDDDAEARWQQANILLSLGKPEDALCALDAAESPRRLESQWLSQRGYYLQLAGRHEEAVESMSMAIALEPTGSALSYLRRADSYKALGKTDKARADYRRCIDLETDSCDTGILPYALIELGRGVEAAAIADSIASGGALQGGDYYELASIYGRMGERGKALGNLMCALEKGYKRFGFMTVDPDLASIRDMPTFKQLLLEYGARKDEDPDDQITNLFREERVEVSFIREDGVCKVKCTVNGLPLHFIFDTGASTVSLSMVEATFMLKNGYLKPSDFIGKQHFVDANGDISEGTVVNIPSINFGGLELTNVRASVVRNQKAPLLLGQSVLSRLGSIEIDNSSRKLIITHKTKL